MSDLSCPTCQVFQGGWEGDLPEAFRQLDLVKLGEGISFSGLYQCPECKTYYMRQVGQEWNMFDEVMIDVVKLYPISPTEAARMIDPAFGSPAYASINTSSHCSRCQSGRIERLRVTKVGKDNLVWCRCLDCGQEEFMDSYEDIEDGV